jgi:hypothetical protein
LLCNDSHNLVIIWANPAPLHRAGDTFYDNQQQFQDNPAHLHRAGDTFGQILISLLYIMSESYNYGVHDSVEH